MLFATVHEPDVARQGESMSQVLPHEIQKPGDETTHAE